MKSISSFSVNSRKKRYNRSRSGVSPVIATTIIIAITVTLGLALWSYANAGVTSATQSYSESVKQYGDFTKERIVITNIGFNNPSANRIALWIFNSGKVDTSLCLSPSDPLRCQDNPSIAVVERGGSAVTPSDFCQNDPADLTRCLPTAASNFRIQPGELKKFSFDISPSTIDNGKTYEITIYSSTAASATILRQAD